MNFFIPLHKTNINYNILNFILLFLTRLRNSWLLFLTYHFLIAKKWFYWLIPRCSCFRLPLIFTRITSTNSWTKTKCSIKKHLSAQHVINLCRLGGKGGGYHWPTRRKYFYCMIFFWCLQEKCLNFLFIKCLLTVFFQHWQTALNPLRKRFWVSMCVCVCIQRYVLTFFNALFNAEQSTILLQEARDSWNVQSTWCKKHK